MTTQAKTAATSALRPEWTNAKRIVVKIGSALLTDRATGTLKTEWLASLLDDVAALAGLGKQVVLVSSGAIALGRHTLKLPKGPLELEQSQAAAAVGQISLAHAYQDMARARGLVAAQILLTLGDTEERTRYLNARHTIETLLTLKAVPVVNENDTVATHEIRFGDNDRLAALVAQLVHADALVLLSDVDGLYDGDPRRPGSRRIAEVRDLSDLDGIDLGKAGRSGLGSGGMQTKVEAARIATGSGIDVILASASDVDAVLNGEPVGTRFRPRAGRRSTRLLWLEHATGGLGHLHLDAGAVRAIVERRLSLLPAGITAVDGTFAAGDPVDLLDETGRAVARGLVNYDSTELPSLLGRTTHELSRELGPAYEREVVHRDDLVVLVGG
jgi:glutamate 5-kinase